MHSIKLLSNVSLYCFFNVATRAAYILYVARITFVLDISPSPHCAPSTLLPQQLRAASPGPCLQVHRKPLRARGLSLFILTLWHHARHKGYSGTNHYVLF